MKFLKMQGSGNDFMVIDNRRRVVRAGKPFALRHCPRGAAVGADGILLLETSRRADLRLRIFNADGSEAEMCANGARCMVQFAVEECGFPRRLKMETRAGDIHGHYRRGRPRVDLTPARRLETDISLATVPGLEGTVMVHAVDTGVPHVILFPEDLDRAPVQEAGRALRHHPRFAPAGVNANFVEVRAEQRIRVRTYERGVEAETLACGTGVAASAIVAARKRGVRSPVAVETQGGDVLRVSFREVEGAFVDLTLEGSTRIVYRGELP